MMKVVRALGLVAVLAIPQVNHAQTRIEGYVRERPDQARDSIASALRIALGNSVDAAVAREAARSLASAYSDVWGDPFLAERVRWVLDLQGAARRDFLVADSLRRRGNDLLFREGPARAREMWRASGQRSSAIGDSVGSVRITGNLGAAFYEEGALDSAAVYLREALEAAERLEDRRTAGNAATILGNIAWERGDLPLAIDFNLRAAKLHEAAGNYTGMAADHNNAGLIAEALGDVQRARTLYERALAISAGHAGGERAADYLVNLAGLALQRSEVDDARARFERALALYRDAGEVVNQALVHRNLGALEAGVSAYEEAIVEYRQSIALYRQLGDVRGEIEVRRLLASVFAAIGRPDEAMEEIARAESLLQSSLPAPDLAAALSVVRGDVELSLSRREDARTSFEKAERLYRVAGGVSGLTAAAQGRAHLELISSRPLETIRGLEPVVALQPPGRERAWSRLLLGVAYAESGDSVLGRATLMEARREFDQASDRAGAAIALGTAATLEMGLTGSDWALRLLDDARRLGAGLPTIEWWLHLRSGRVLEAARDLDGAAAQYDSAVSVVEGLGDWVRFDDRRAMYLEDKWEAYAALARLSASRGESGRAVALSERLRARYLLDQLARRRSVSPPEGSLRAQERRLSERIAELTVQLNTSDDGTRGPAELGSTETREELIATQAAYRRTLDQMRDEEPDYMRALRGETASLREIQDALGPRDLLLEYLVSDDQLWIFAVSDSGVTQLSIAIGRAALRAQIDFARWALESQRGREDLWREALRRLDDVLLEPVRRAGLLSERRTVIVVPHLELHYLPFEALVDSKGDGDRYFIETHDVVYAPSASVWLRLAERMKRGRRGVLALAPLDKELEGTVKEVEGVREVWRAEAAVRRGAAATEEIVTEGGGYHVLHLATRGVLNRHNPLFSYVQLHPGVDGDGRLEVQEVLQMELPADLVVLSACQTALAAGAVGDVPLGDDWVGLVRAFIHAGADNVIATLWAVDDRRSADFVVTLHQKLAASESYAQALGDAKREAIGSEDLSNPYYWAGFVLTGVPPR